MRMRVTSYSVVNFQRAAFYGVVGPMVMVGLAVASLGCASGSAGQSGQWSSSSSTRYTGTSSDVGRILALYDKQPWLRRVGALKQIPLGIRISSVYLISSETNTGVFGNGLIRMVIYKVERTAEGEREHRRVAQWEYDVEKAIQWRTTKTSWMGQGYQFDLRWPEDVDLRGQTVCLTIEFVRPDGKIVRATPKYLPVPSEL